MDATILSWVGVLVAVFAILMLCIHKSGIAARVPGARPIPMALAQVLQPKKSGWVVKFGHNQYPCDMLGDNGTISKLVRVHLPGGRFHQTTRPLSDIEWVA